MKIDPRLDLAFKILIFVFGVFVAGLKLWHPHWMSLDTSNDIESFLSIFLLPIVSGIYMIVGTGATPSITAVGKVASLLIMLGISCWLFPHQARAANVTTTVFNKAISDFNAKIAALQGKVNGATGLTGNATSDVNGLVAKLQAVSLADLKAAKADADGTHDVLASNCYAPLIDLVTAQQAVAAPAQNTDNPGAKVPTTHLVLDFQRARDIRNALQPTSPVGIGCSPMAQQVKLDLVSFIGQIAAGTISLATFGL